MPISFLSESHGQIAVGFFNIETDMLLMDRYFFFAGDFCNWVMEWASDHNCLGDERPVYSIENPDMIGNLAGAIYGYEFTGFIGEVYKRFPFPESRAGFKQKPYGSRNRDTVKQIIRSFATRVMISVTFSEADRTIRFGDYVFQQKVFQEVIRYVEAGGMPRWLNEQPPDYVMNMIAALDGSEHRLLK